MSAFTPPQIGSKLGEFKPDFANRFSKLFLLNKIYNELDWFVKKPLPVALAFLFEIALIRGDISLGIRWVDWTIAILSILISVVVIGYDIYERTYLPKPKSLRGSTFSLYLVKNGVEINDYFIPFRNTSSQRDSNGIVFFKINGNKLMLKTEGDPFLLFNRKVTENQMEFVLEPNYWTFKEELLSYLNSLIEENQQ
jgi:hypothetical protein